MQLVEHVALVRRELALNDYLALLEQEAREQPELGHVVLKQKPFSAALYFSGNRVMRWLPFLA